MIRVMKSNGFERCEREGLVFYRCSALDHMAHVRHGFSTRFGAIAEDSGRRLLDALGLSRVPLVTLAQIHSDKVQVIREDGDVPGQAGKGDALTTRRNGVALGVRVADCFPILLADPATGAIAAVHSGWRGTAARILRKAVEAMKDAFAASPASLFVVIGPGIRSCCMQVGPEVAARYEEAYPGLAVAAPEPGVGNKYLLDMPRALLVQCAEAGIRPEKVFDIRACTRCRCDEFFSFRAEGSGAGRMLAVIGRLPGNEPTVRVKD